MRRVARISLCLLPALVLGCAKEMPVEPDGAGRVTVSVADVSGVFEGSVPGEPFPIEPPAEG